MEGLFQLTNLEFQLARIFVQLVVGGAIALLAINVARGAFSAQVANTIGNAVGVSQAWANIITSIFLFAIAALSPIVIGAIADGMRSYVEGADLLNNITPFVGYGDTYVTAPGATP